MNASSLRPTNGVDSENGTIPESSHGLVTTALLVVLVAVAASAGIRAYQPRHYRAASLAMARAVPSQGAELPATGVDVPSASPDEVIEIDSPPEASLSTGAVMLPPAAEGHRVYVDGRLVGDAVSEMRVACGRHLIKVGSRGHDHAVTVPCGGELSVAYP